MVVDPPFDIFASVTIAAVFAASPTTGTIHRHPRSRIQQQIDRP